MNKYTYVNMPLGQLVRRAREAKGLNQREFADLLFITPSALCRWENGSRRISVQDLCDIADALEVSLDELVGRSRQ